MNTNSHKFLTIVASFGAAASVFGQIALSNVQTVLQDTNPSDGNATLANYTVPAPQPGEVNQWLVVVAAGVNLNNNGDGPFAGASGTFGGNAMSLLGTANDVSGVNDSVTSVFYVENASGTGDIFVDFAGLDVRGGDSVSLSAFTLANVDELAVISNQAGFDETNPVSGTATVDAGTWVFGSVSANSTWDVARDGSDNALFTQIATGENPSPVVTTPIDAAQHKLAYDVATIAGTFGPSFSASAITARSTYLGFTATEIPEPSAFGALAGLLALVALRRR